MSLWGNQEVKGATGTISTWSVGGVIAGATGTNTAFANSNLGDYIVIGTEHYLITDVISTTAVKLRPGVPGATGGTVRTNAGLVYYSEKPQYVTTAESYSATGESGDITKVYGVDTGEMIMLGSTGIPGVQHAGWVRRVLGTGARAGRIQYETLVAMGTTSTTMGDADGNTTFYNRTITINTQPQSGATGVTGSRTFTVAATDTYANATFTYQWYGPNSSTALSGANSSSLTVGPPTTNGATGLSYYAIVTNEIGQSVTSNTATLTVRTA